MQIGEIFGLFHGATGLAFLAFMPAERRSKLLKQAPRDLGRPRRQLVDELDTIRARGYAHTVGQRVEGAAAISAPIFNMRREVSYCMTITGPATRMAGREQEFIELVTSACRTISAKLGATG